MAEPSVVPTDLDRSELRELRRKVRDATLAVLRALGGEARRDAVLELALADDGFTLRELEAPAPERAATKYVRLVDQQLSWALTNLKRDGLLENPKRCIWKLTDAATQVAPRTDSPVDEQRLVELRAMPYQLYLRTPEWRRTRAAALLRADNCCALDITHTDGLEVHHRTYERRGAELTSDLVVLCHSCHQLHHQEYGRPRREPSARPRPMRVTMGADIADESAVKARERRKPSLLRRLVAS